VKLPEPDTVQSYNLFLSSSDETDTRRLRDRVQRLVYEVINPRLSEYEQAGVRLDIQRWEQTAPQRVAEGGVNQLFVAKVRRSALTMVLLLDEIRPGTREEFEAASPSLRVRSPYSSSTVQVAQMPRRRPSATTTSHRIASRFSTTPAAASRTVTTHGSRL
jgi:hypothetical protein